MYAVAGVALMSLPAIQQDSQDSVESLPFGEPANEPSRPTAAAITASVATATVAATEPSGASPDSPELRLILIELPDTTNEPIVSVDGFAPDGTRIFSPSGQVAVAVNEQWNLDVSLLAGSNEIVIEALSADGTQIVTEQINITYVPTAVEAVEFTADQEFGTGSGAEPFDIFSGTATPFTQVRATSDFGSATTTADADGAWTMAVFFDVSYQPFTVTVSGDGGSADFDYLYSPGQ